MKNWTLGQEAEMQGPFGFFTLKSLPDRDLILAATATGIAPLRAMIENRLTNNAPGKIQLYLGVRSENDIFYQEILDSWTRKHPQFTYTYCLSRSKENRTGRKGRVTQILQGENLEIKNTDVYLCGGKEMITELLLILKKKGFKEDQIHFEQYFL
ncbi:MAG: 2Fe-2S iron-sulfur cluster binding domain-containing protein 3, CDP-4-dehydro-6-deoxyglucose reductase [Candidatus Peregrinibacteria bacterium GW2011_GWE2_39_6]|nr:MAG: 2Fe-2S iron-sulfur cluster binding domain-containing protein 3, CDP-4-dehydro-6-deoxyglucose reductase [Candidatus Peregrinibacteria bacterium GW2011_GWE2_39_6]